ncbi:MAG: hypothetical protein RMY28_020030 [Nostoc sp. ChiSLP01]
MRGSDPRLIEEVGDLFGSWRSQLQRRISKGECAKPKAIACVITNVVQGIDHIPANNSLQRFIYLNNYGGLFVPPHRSRIKFRYAN